jgi:hypothetical protein
MLLHGNIGHKNKRINVHNVLRCQRKTVLGTDYFFSHLPGVREITSYKSNHHSRVVDEILGVVAKEQCMIH